MEIPPQFTITNKIITLLAKIEANKAYIQTLKIPDKIITNLTHLTLLKSSVYSAQIEGNSLTPDDIENTEEDDEKQYERQEIENIIQALTTLRENGIPDVIDVPYLLNLHKLIMNKLVHTSQSGVIRREPSAIFDGNGNVIYMTPPPAELNKLIISLLHLINESNDLFPLIKAPLVHLCFEKIHPFLDGNGRVGRLIFQAILAKYHYHFNWLISIEELLQQKKHTYYYLLEQNDATGFIEFMLEILLEESERLKNQIDELASPTEEDFLLPRRREILEIIRDHTVVSVEQIQRRFLKVPGRTLRYDIQQLEKQGLIRKIGTTRGAMYQIRKK
jgi:Fic family protein